MRLPGPGSTPRSACPACSICEVSRVARLRRTPFDLFRRHARNRRNHNDAATGAQSFKGIFVRDFTMMAVIAKTTAKDTNSHHQLGVFWAGPIADRTSWSQASALDALVASLKLP